MTDSDKENSRSQVVILRLRHCRRSDLIVNFLRQEKIPHRIYYLPEDEDAQRLAKKFQILASPGIIVNNQIVNPHQLIAKCQIKNPKMASAYIKELLGAKDKENA